MKAYADFLDWILLMMIFFDHFDIILINIIILITELSNLEKVESKGSLKLVHNLQFTIWKQLKGTDWWKIKFWWMKTYPYGILAMSFGYICYMNII